MLDMTLNMSKRYKKKKKKKKKKNAHKIKDQLNVSNRKSCLVYMYKVFCAFTKNT